MTQLTRRQQQAVDRVLAAFPAPPGEYELHGVVFAVTAIVERYEPHEREFILDGVSIYLGLGIGR